jgi:hypothetical protein
VGALQPRAEIFHTKGLAAHTMGLVAHTIGLAVLLEDGLVVEFLVMYLTHVINGEEGYTQVIDSNAFFH